MWQSQNGPEEDLFARPHSEMLAGTSILVVLVHLLERNLLVREIPKSLTTIIEINQASGLLVIVISASWHLAGFEI